jgi:hypothetical protein
VIAMRVRFAVWTLLVALGPTAPSPAGDDLRSELAAFGAALDQAVQKVSRPATLHLLGGGTSVRGYYLEGIGAFFVVSPRALPPERRAIVVSGRAVGGDALAVAVQELERGLARVESAETRAAIERSIEELRRSSVSELASGRQPLEGEIRAQARRLDSGAEGARETVEPDQQAGHLERPERQREWRRPTSERERELRSLEAQAEALQREAERIRSLGELHLEQIHRAIQVRLAAPAAPPSPAQPPGAPAAPPVAAVAPPQPPEPPLPPPPWHFWFDTTQAQEPRASENVVADVRTVTMEVLVTRGAALERVAPDELVVVAVDFIAPAGFALTASHERTLVLRVKKNELDAHQAGRLPAEQLAQRVQVVEY